jgi:hypothetical protein
LVNSQNQELFGLKQIMLFTIVATLSFSINNAYGDAVCPKDTEWDGENCIHLDTGIPIVFTDYLGNPVKNSDKSDQDANQVQNTVITKPVHEILIDLMIIKPEINEIDHMEGKALEQKILYDEKIPTNLTRNNYHFNQIIEYSMKNAEVAFDKSVYGKQIQNPDFGKNNEPQIQYSKRYERSEDPVLQNGMTIENLRAQQTFLKNFGNFTNY